MCKKIETQIYQQTLILKRQQGDLRRMVDEYNRQNEDADSTQSPSQHSSQDDWQEVIEMAKKPIEFVLSRSNSSSSSHSGSSSGGSTANNGSSSRDEVFKSVYYSSSPSSSTATTISSSGENVPVKSRKAYTQQMTPPIEEIIEFREKLREIERSPLFMATPPTKRGQIGALFSSSQNTPLSLP
ncbi:hypothetical protein GGI12_005083 [Dipsacomyces acuminosporus]|nr:hypothetical protein GGI12_005083 [Dipsacomyces acuminosporus]